MPQYVPVNFTDFTPAPDMVAPPRIDYEFHDYAKVKNTWGNVDVSGMLLPNMHLMKLDGELHHHLHVAHHENQESTTVDTCIFLHGSIESKFAGFTKSLTMHSGNHNFMYGPELNNDHYIQGDTALKLIHFSVDRLYYAQLLCDSEKWSAQLKEKLLNKEVVCGPLQNNAITPGMMRILHDLDNCGLQGNLRRLVVEAKVLEFIALQLDQLMRQSNGAGGCRLSTRDQEAFHGLREYLQRTFTEEHSLGALAKAFGLNEFKLKKGFRELFGTTVFDYLHDLKMEHARVLLSDTDAQVTAVSGLVGYKNPNHFSTAFKKKFGHNPTQFRKTA